MITRWRTEYPVLKQGEWADFMQTAQECALGWAFKEVDAVEGDGRRGSHPDVNAIRDLDLMDLLSLGRCQMPYVEVNEAKAFAPEKDYGTKDESDPISDECYKATERLIDLACIWNAHRARNGRGVIGLPKRGYDRDLVKAAVNEAAEKDGIIYEIEAYMSGVPLRDVLAGYEGHAEPDDMWGIAWWQVSYKKKTA